MLYLLSRMFLLEDANPRLETATFEPSNRLFHLFLKFYLENEEIEKHIYELFFVMEEGASKNIILRLEVL